MAKIGDLVMGVVVETRKAVQNLRKMRGEVSGFARNIKTAVKDIDSLSFGILGLGGILGGAALARRFRQITAEIDDLTKLAPKLQLTTQSLQEFQHVALISAGVTDKQLNMALQRFRRRTQEAAEGTGEAVNVLKELRLNAKELIALPADEAFDKVRRAVQETTKENQRLRIAFKLFDSEGAALVNTLNLTEEQFKSLRIEAHRFGGVLDDPTIKNVSELDTNFRRLTLSIKGASRELVGYVSGPLNDFIAYNEAMANHPHTQMMTELLSARGFTAESMQEIREQYRRSQQGPTAAGLGATAGGSARIGRFDQALTKIANTVRDIPKARESLQTAAFDFQTKVKIAGQQWKMDVEWANKQRREMMEREQAIATSQQDVFLDIMRHQEKMVKERQERRDRFAERVADRYGNQQTFNALAPALRRGSAEYVNAMNRTRAGRKSIEQISEEILKEDQDRNNLLVQIRDKLAGVDIPP